METKRFQLDLTEKEHAEMERLMAFAGIKTKREFISNAVTMFRWAAMELLQGRKIGSIDDNGGMKQLEMPALQSFSELGLDSPLLTIEELHERSRQPTRKLKDFLAESTDKGATHDELTGTRLEPSSAG